MTGTQERMTVSSMPFVQILQMALLVLANLAIVVTEDPESKWIFARIFLIWSLIMLFPDNSGAIVILICFVILFYNFVSFCIYGHIALCCVLTFLPFITTFRLNTSTASNDVSKRNWFYNSNFTRDHNKFDFKVSL